MAETSRESPGGPHTAEGPNLNAQGGVVSHSEPVMNPTGGAGLGRADTQPALDTHLMERVVEPENRQRAWQRVKANKGAPGIDRMTFDQGDAWLILHWPHLREALLAGTYHRCRFLARTLATQTGMTNKSLAEQGLLSIRALWMKAHGYA